MRGTRWRVIEQQAAEVAAAVAAIQAGGLHELNW
jgi:hypothetical protein